MVRLLFLCTGNSARSILAEAIASERFGDLITARSAGSRPRGRPHPLALETLRRHGLPTTPWRSKSWDELRGQTFDLVVTLCDSAAAESCPVFPGQQAREHWGFPDPPASDDPEGTFEQVFEGLTRVLTAFVENNHPDIATRAQQAARVLDASTTTKRTD